MMPTNYSEYSPPPPYNETCSVPITHSLQNPASTSAYRPNVHFQSTRLFCGCGPKTWTKIIACIEIILSLSSLVMRLIASASSTKETSYGMSDSSRHDEYETFTKFGTDPKFQALEGTVGAIFGFILLAGAHYGKPALLLIWLIMCGLGLGLTCLILIILVLAIFMGGGIIAFVVIFLVLIPFSIQAFCFHVVALHRRELIDHQNQMLHPTVQFHSVYVDPSKQNF